VQLRVVQQIETEESYSESGRRDSDSELVHRFQRIILPTGIERPPCDTAMSVLLWIGGSLFVPTMPRLLFWKQVDYL
jgi:hypothetical protein